MTEEQLKKEYEDKLSKLREQQSKCNHEWSPIQYDPEVTLEPYGYKTIVQGSDVWGEPEGYHKVKHDRWSRKCLKCDKIEYTIKQVAVKYEPKF